MPGKIGSAFAPNARIRRPAPVAPLLAHRFDRLDLIGGDGHKPLRVAGIRTVDEHAGTQYQANMTVANVVMPAVAQPDPKWLKGMLAQTFEQIVKGHYCPLLVADESI
jgi:hypothetical protein